MYSCLPIPEHFLTKFYCSLGALTTLQYNLTAAPASQPRNTIFAQVFAITISILLSYIPNVPPWFRSALAPSIVVPGMAMLGIIHPPQVQQLLYFQRGKITRGSKWVSFFVAFPLLLLLPLSLTTRVTDVSIQQVGT